MKQVLVFKTTISPSQVITVEPLLDKLVNKNGRWNFDLEDCDKILRVETEHIRPSSIIEELAGLGVFCSELD